MTPRPMSRAALFVVALWAPYTALNTLFPGPLLTYSLGLILAGAALAMLRSGGVAPCDLGLCLARPSAAGLLALATLSLFIPLALSLGRGQPWQPLDDLVYAPASALGQELYFRAALLPALLGRRTIPSCAAVPLQALLFALWHVRAFRVVAVAPAVAVLAGAFAAGAIWGWQVRRDRTILYAVAEHTLFLIVQ